MQPPTPPGPVLAIMGDSKSIAPGYSTELGMALNATFAPARLIGGGWKASDLNAATDAWLSAATETPDFVLLNVGINDAAAHTSQATFESQLGQLLDKVHAKWADAKIFVMLVWGRGFVDCEVIDSTYIPNVLATRGGFAFVGGDERIFLQGSDSGFTYTSDGIHPNAAGYSLTAQAWQEAMGY